MLAIKRQKIEMPKEDNKCIILYMQDDRNAAITLAARKRSEGMMVQLIRKSSKHSVAEYEEYAKRFDVKDFIYLSDNA